jgi:hypothetical protein
MTEADARALLRDWPGVGGLEAWIDGRRWNTAPSGWIVIPAGLRISASAPGNGDPAVWVVTG